MKKFVIPVSAFVILIPCIIITMACGDDTGLGSDPTPENIFNGGEWEDIEYIYNDYFDTETHQLVQEKTDEIKYIKNLSFTENIFTFYEKQNSPSYYEHTYTGTYRLFYYGDYQSEMIEFISDEPSMNGTARYYHENIYKPYPSSEKYPDGTIWILNFTGYDNINGIYPKTN